MVQFLTNSVRGYKDLEVSYTFIKKEEHSKNLAILLPGNGYTTSHPLFHYSTGLFITKEFDVLAVNYQYNSPTYDKYSNEELCEAIKLDVNTVLTTALKDKNYENITFVAKSLGTIALASEITKMKYAQAKAVWLTPLIQRDDVYNAMLTSKNRGLSVIGDKDRCFIEERYNQIKLNENMTAKLIPNVNHSLEYNDDAIASIDVLKNVINDIAQFAIQKKPRYNY
jgi:hypothetical protein